MELKVNKEDIFSSEIILRKSQEQPIELDYVLPDYQPEIFRIAKCFVTPALSSYSINGSTLTYELGVTAKVLYFSEESDGISTVEQRLVFTKNTELDVISANPEISIIPTVSYVNCKAANKRRIDLRGAVSVSITVKDMSVTQVISDVFGMGTMVHKREAALPVKHLYSEERITVNEEFELGVSKPDIDSIISCDGVILSVDRKVIANKAVAKGEAAVNIFYTCENCRIEPMQFTLPFSKIVDIEGVDERFETYVEAELLSCEVVPRSDSEGRNTAVECHGEIILRCYADLAENTLIADDVYSTEYETSAERSEIRADCIPMRINESVSAKVSVKKADEPIATVYGVKSDVKNCSFTVDSGGISCFGTGVFTLMAGTDDSNTGKTVFVDKEEPLNFTLPCENITQGSIISLKLVPVTVSYNILPDSAVDIKADYRIIGSITPSVKLTALTDVTVDETSAAARDRECALKLYFADKGESVWDIAKKYRASASAVMEENDLDTEDIAESIMLVIPMT
jgi:hypothetical protein